MLLFTLAACAELFGGPKISDTAGCTEIGCTDGVSLDFSLTTPGAYVITAVAAGEPVRCTATLPFDGTEACTGPGWVGISGTELPDEEQSIEGMWLETVEATDVHLTITRDDESVLDETIPVTYDTLTPNGPACEPTCTFARVEFTGA